MSIYSLSFDGIIGKGTATDSFFSSGSGPWSISFWFKTSSSGSGFYGALHYGTDSIARAVQMYLHSSRLTMDLYSAAINETFSFNDGNWHHFLGTSDGTTGKMYVDGVLQVSNAWSSTPNATLSGTCLVGYDNTDYWSGKLCEVAVFNSTLIQANATSLAAGSTSYSKVISGGAFAAGFADVTTHWLLSPVGGIAGSGQADQLLGVTNPSRYVFYRFFVGQLVFRYSFVTRAYLPGRVRATYLNGIDNYYDFGDEELVSERLILTPEEYRAQLGGTLAALQRDALRHKDRLSQIPSSLNARGGLVKTIKYTPPIPRAGEVL